MLLLTTAVPAFAAETEVIEESTVEVYNIVDKAKPPKQLNVHVGTDASTQINVTTRMKGTERFRDIPVIMATAKGQEYDRIHGLDLGADDYMVKPFSIMELVSRVKAVLRRSQPQQVSKLLKTDGLVVNLDEHTVMVDGSKVRLTYKEFELLRIFLSHPGMVYTREQLFAQVWQMDYMGDSRTLDSHIRTLRQKLDGYGKMIETVRNVGYRWEAGYDK